MFGNAQHADKEQFVVVKYGNEEREWRMNRMKEETVGGISRYLSKVPYVFECIISVIMLLVILVETALLVQHIAVGVMDPSITIKINELMDSILWLVIGLEFVRMLLEHSHAAVLEIMLFAIARQMIVAHTSMLENLLAVLAIGGIFAVRKYLYAKE